jgi:hypothetical protein
MIRVRFIKSGVSCGYAYNSGEVGIVRSQDVGRLQAGGYIQVLEVQPLQKPEHETPERNKPKYEKRNK